MDKVKDVSSLLTEEEQTISAMAERLKSALEAEELL